MTLELLLTIGIFVVWLVVMWLYAGRLADARLELTREAREIREIYKKGPRVQVGPNLWQVGEGDHCTYEGPPEDWEVAILSEKPRLKRKFDKMRK